MSANATCHQRHVYADGLCRPCYLASSPPTDPRRCQLCGGHEYPTQACGPCRRRLCSACYGPWQRLACARCRAAGAVELAGAR
jgi:hypothetical protein